MKVNADLYGPAMEPDLHQAPEPKWPSAAASVFVWAQQQLPPTPSPAAAQAAADAQAAAQAQANAHAQAAAQASWELQALTKELETAQAELHSLHELLEEIPEIFERKFEQRLQPLLAENQALRQQLRQLKPADPAPRRPRLLSPPRVIRQAFGLDKAA